MNDKLIKGVGNNFDCSNLSPKKLKQPLNRGVLMTQQEASTNMPDTDHDYIHC